MAGVYVNNQKAIYATDTRVNTITNSITNLTAEVDALQFDVTTLAGEVGTLQTDVNDLQNDLLPSMVQYYKNLLPITSTPLTGNVYDVVIGATTTSVDIPTAGLFIVASPGVLQYIGPSTFYFQINYQITASIDSGNFNCIFLLHRNNVELTSSRQTVSMDETGTHNLVAANGSALTPLSPGDNISLRAQLLDSAVANALDVNDISLSIFKIPSSV